MLLLLGGDDTVGDFGEVGPHYIGPFDERVEGLSGDEGGGAPCAQGSRHVPRVGRDEANPTLGDLQRPRGHPVGGWRRFEAFRRVGGEDLLEPVCQPGILYLGLGDLLRGVGKRTQPRISRLSSSEISTPCRSSVILRAAAADSPKVT